MQSHRFALLIFLAYALLGALLFLRPHEETFIGLDNSFIRMLTHAMAQGRDQVGVDQTLVQVPYELRKHFIYQSDEGQRLTRDRTFQIDDLEGCKYRPFFYPVLSYAALAFNRIVPGLALDYFLPSLALLFLILAGWFMLAKTGIPGLLAGLGLLLSLPLLPWFGRGYYPELCGLLIISITALHWLAKDGAYRRFIPASFAMGLALCFHPVIALWSGTLFLLMAVDDTRKTRDVSLALLAFALGMLPLLLITRFVTQPYGNIFSYYWLTILFQTSTIYFLFIVAAFFACCSMVILLLARGRALLGTLFFSPGLSAHVSRLCVAVLPAGLQLLFQKTKAETLVGLTDIWSLLNSPYGLVVTGTILASLHPVVRPRPRALLVMTVALASVFLYLKGTEPFGLWSQRRLLPITIPLLVASLGVWRDILAAWSSMQWKRHLASGSLIFIAIVMISQYPHFYLLRSENNADAIIQKVLQATDGALTIFDYHHYGSPFVALDRGSTLILYDHISLEDQGEVFTWAAKEAIHRSVIWITVFDNPGLEHGVRLEQIQTIQDKLPRLHAKRVFPAEVHIHPLSMSLLQMRPLTPDQPLPPLDKIMDNGPLARRGPWGRGDISLPAPDGERLPATWTRQGSAIIGPIPPPGQSVQVELTAGAHRSGGLDHQIMIITPPWDGPPLEMRVENPHTVVTARLQRPADFDHLSETTGKYTLTSRYPYDPSTQGIQGFASDLGVLLHRIRIEVVIE